ncbi:hypothetical protein BU15DRAFT_71291 [Melanogaster broomeanus]|nr:hypothetical protein BU15DRAFT_71291 [Melanogaster broomeanus]
MEAGFQYRSRTMSSPHYDYPYTPCVRSKTADPATPPRSISRLPFPQRRDTTYRHESTVPSPLHWKNARSWIREQDVSKPVHRQTTEEWVNEQIHLAESPNYEGRARPYVKEELRQRMWDELLYEYEAEAHRWMKHETETRRRAQEREREETRRRIIQEDISRIQARVRQRRDSERQIITEERRKSAERAIEKVQRGASKSGESNVGSVEFVRITVGSRSLLRRSHSSSMIFQWPLLTSPACATDITAENITSFLMHPVHSSNHTRRERIRTALLRWHPDRFRRILPRVVESETSAVEEGVGVVARCLNELLGKEGKTTRKGK